MRRDCWHVHDRVAYPDTAGIFPKTRKWENGDHAKYRWHEHDGALLARRHLGYFLTHSA